MKISDCWKAESPECLTQWIGVAVGVGRKFAYESDYPFVLLVGEKFCIENNYCTVSTS